jgi:hypothetical protein
MPVTLARRARRVAVGALCALAFALPLQSLAAANARTTPYTSLNLINGWTDTPDGTARAAVRIVNGIVYFKGAVSFNHAISTPGSTSSVPFTLPAAFRPAAKVFIPVDLCNAHRGDLVIFPGGTVEVQAEHNLSDAQCFTSLDGASFAKSGTSFTSLTLQNGWKDSLTGTAHAAARIINGIVHLRGGMATTGGSVAAFTLPKALRPAKVTYVPADMCDGATGRLFIQPTGLVQVQAEHSSSAAQCFTSLDGISFAKSGTSFTSLTLRNGWENTKFGTAHAAARLISGIVHLRGAMSTTGNAGRAFTLPKALRPATNVFLHVDMCGAANGRLFIQPSGLVTVLAENGVFSNAQCFTSLDGAAFAR